MKNKLILASLLILGLNSCTKEDEPQTPKNPYIFDNGCPVMDSIGFHFYKPQNGGQTIIIHHNSQEKVFMGKKYERIDCNLFVYKNPLNSSSMLVDKIDFLDNTKISINGTVFIKQF